MTSGLWALVWRFGLVLFAALVLQAAVMADLLAFGQFGDLLLVVAIAAGLVAGPDRGATLGFVTGLAYDLMVVDTPFGLSALAYAVVAYGVGVAAGWVVQPRRWFPVAAAVLASVVAVALAAVVGRVLGRELPFDEIVAMAAVEAVWSAALVLPARRALRWVIGYDPTEPYRMAVP